MDDMIWDAARRWQRFLDDRNGTGPLEIACRIMKVTEEAGEVNQAWIGLLGQNPRKGVTHTTEDVVGELADVAFAALVAIASLGADPRTAVQDVVTKANGYLPAGPGR